jgi:hypothetical protein
MIFPLALVFENMAWLFRGNHFSFSLALKFTRHEPEIYPTCGLRPGKLKWLKWLPLHNQARFSKAKGIML